MIGVNHALVDLAKDRDGVAGIGWKHEGGVILTGVSNASSVPGSMQTATEQSSGAANPR
jgi:hypothetical protein